MLPDRGAALALVGAAALAVAAPRDARADDGPLYALGRMMDASPTLTLVTSSVTILANASLTTIDGIAATKNQELGLGMSAMEITVTAPQTLGFAAAPFFFDITRWETAEVLGLLIPFQAWSAALTTHGVWSISRDAANVPQAGRVGVSFLVGANWAFTTTALGGLTVWGKGAPAPLAAVEIGFGAGEAALAIERAVNDPDNAPGWGGLATWSLLIATHGVVSLLAPGRRSSFDEGGAARPSRRRAPRVGWPMPYATVRGDTYSFGAAGLF